MSQVKKRDILVKKNAATILREASRVIKEEEKEIEKVNQLMCGGVLSCYEELAEQARVQEEQAALQDLQRKHLQGLLTREQAILARHKLLEANKAKRERIEEEKKETEEMIKEMRKRDSEQLKGMIEKTQRIQKSIMEKKENMIKEKHKQAQEVTETNKKVYEETMLKQKEDLEKRIQIIKEIKALASFKEHHTNTFDPTETMNLGLLSEMSIAELQERLQINKIALNEEITKRQACTRKQRMRQQEFLIETEKFIETCRRQKKQIKESIKAKETNPDVSFADNQDIQELKRKLEKAREKRFQVTKINKRNVQKQIL